MITAIVWAIILLIALLVFIGLFILLMTVDIPGLAVLTDSRILSIPGA